MYIYLFQLREQFHSKIITCLLNNFKACEEQSKIYLTGKNINDIACKVEYNIVCSAKAISTYRFLATQKVCNIRQLI